MADNMHNFICMQALINITHSAVVLQTRFNLRTFQAGHWATCLVPISV